MVVDNVLNAHLSPGIEIVARGESLKLFNSMDRENFLRWARSKSRVVNSPGLPVEIVDFSLVARVNGVDSFGRKSGVPDAFYVFQCGNVEYYLAPEKDFPEGVPAYVTLRIGGQ